MNLALEIWRRCWPFLVAAGIGFGSAWWIQGLNVRAVTNDFKEYQVEQQRLKNEAEEEQRKRQGETSSEYQKNVKQLESDVAAGNAYRRCVAAGKCGGLRAVPSCSGIRLSAAGIADGAGPDPVPAAGEPAPPMIAECAATTLQLNSLQADIERQRGY